MLHGVIIRGTNPEHEFELPYPADIIDNIRVIYGQNGIPVLTKALKSTTEPCLLEPIGELNSRVIVRLTEKETYSISASRPLDIEIRVQFADGKIVRSEDLISLRVLDTMDNEVMTNV
jgi:hypothetical protein